MLLDLPRGNLPRAELEARMTTDDCHRAEPDVADNREDQGGDLPPPPPANNLPHAHDPQTGQ
eukprot:5014655-Pyramimonas_sp.AAC.1